MNPMPQSQVNDFLDWFLESRGAEEIWVACSGGLDSMVLLELARIYALSRGRRLGVMHANHGLRAAAVVEEKLVFRQVVGRHGLPLLIGQLRGLRRQVAKKSGLSLETAARKARYRLFYRLLRQRPQAVLLTAHHADDQAETMLFNLMRGSGLRGLKGIPRCRGRIGRPLLTLSREALEDFAGRRQLEWCRDESNFSPEFSRNRIRHELMPVLRRLGGAGVESRIAAAGLRLADDLGLIENLLAEMAPLPERDSGAGLSYSRLSVQSLPTALRPHWLVGFFHRAAIRRQIPARVIEALLALVGKPGERHRGRFQLGDGFVFVVDEDLIHLCFGVADEPETEPELKIAGPGLYAFGSSELELRPTREKTADQRSSAAASGRELVDAAELRFPLSLRHRRPGDCFQPLGLNGRSRKLKKYLADLKIPAAERDQQLLLLDADDRVVWVVGRRLDHRFRLRPESEDVFELIWRRRDVVKNTG